MPYALVTIGLILVIAGANNRQGDLAAQLKKDFSGPNNFFYWIAGLGIVGALGYVPALRNVSRMFMTLVVLVMVIRDGAFFDKFKQELAGINAPPPAGEAAVGAATADPGAAPAQPGASAPASNPAQGAAQGAVQGAIGSLGQGFGAGGAAILGGVGSLFGGVWNGITGGK